MPINTLLSAVMAWGERTFAKKADAASSAELDALAKATDARLSEVAAGMTRVVNVKRDAGGNVSMDATFNEIDEAVKGGRPLVFVLINAINPRQTDYVATVDVHDTEISTPTYTAAFLSTRFNCMYEIEFNSNEELYFYETSNPFFPFARKDGKLRKNGDLAQLFGDEWYAVAPGDMAFTTSTGASTTLSALDSRLSAIESTPNAEGVSF